MSYPTPLAMRMSHTRSSNLVVDTAAALEGAHADNKRYSHEYWIFEPRCCGRRSNNKSPPVRIINMLIFHFSPTLLELRGAFWKLITK